MFRDERGASRGGAQRVPGAQDDERSGGTSPRAERPQIEPQGGHWGVSMTDTGGSCMHSAFEAFCCKAQREERSLQTSVFLG